MGDLRRVRILGVWASVWAGLTLVTTLVAWFFAPPGADGARALANLIALVTMPARSVLRNAAGIDTRSSLAIAHAMTWSAVLLGVRLCAALLCRASRPTASTPDPSRRAFLARSGVGIAGVGLAAAPSYATLVGPWDLRVDRVSVPIRDLPSAFDGLRIVQITDTHIGPKIPRSFVERAVRMAIDLEPDLFVLTGDYVCGSTAYLDDAAAVLRPLVGASRLGVLGVLGNHDHWIDGPRMARSLSLLGVRMIDNDRVFIDPALGVTDAPSKGSLALVGLGDLITDDILPDRAFRGVPHAMPRVVLAHHPDTAELPAFAPGVCPRIDLMLSGHTHGGQIRLPIVGTPVVPSDFGSKYAAGLVEGPACRVFVSRGVGMSVLPVRVGVPPEINDITLTRA